MKKFSILLSIIILLLATPVVASDLINPEDLPEEVAIEFGKVVTVEKGKDYKVLIPGRDYIPNNSRSMDTGVSVENTNTTDGYIYLKGKFNNVGQYLIKIQKSYFLINVIEINEINTEKVTL